MEEQGFSILDLMFALLVLAIVGAVAVPSYLGERNLASHTAAETTVRNAVDALETDYASDAAFVLGHQATLALYMRTQEGAIQWASTPVHATNSVFVAPFDCNDSGSGCQSVAVVAWAPDNTCWAAADIQSPGSSSGLLPGVWFSEFPADDGSCSVSIPLSGFWTRTWPSNNNGASQLSQNSSPQPSPNLQSLNCAEQFGGPYMASVSGGYVTVVLNSDCQSTPYTLTVWSAPGNTTYQVDPYPSDCQPSTTDAYCTNPSNSNYPQDIYSYAQFTGEKLTLPLPKGCWQLDVYDGTNNPPYGSLASSSSSLAPGAQFVWGEVGPSGSC